MRIVLYIAVSVDGFIAPADGALEWLAPYETVDYGYDAFFAEMDVVVMGRLTYEQSLAFGDWPYWGKEVFVLTSRQLESDLPGLSFVSDARALAADLRGRAEGAAWLVGGTGVIADFLAAGAVDELRLFHIPVLLGSGRPLFTPQPGAKLQLIDSQTYDNGVVGTVYRVTR